MKPLRWPVYVPANKVGWFRHMQGYLKDKYNRTTAHHLLDLLLAFERNEVERGRKEKYHEQG